MSAKSNVPTPHIGAMPGEIAETILLPGDPLRAQFIAENYLSNVKQFNSVRSMFGFTGTYEEKPVSVMGTGMGCPSMGVLAIEMEAAALYTNAAFGKANALTILTISDHLLTGESTSAEERQTSFTDMMKVALSLA